MRRIAVIGGGIAGLTVALRRAMAGDQVVVFESAAKVGGQLSTEESHGYVIEHGAEGFVARSRAVPALAAEAGIAEHLVEQMVQNSFRFDAGGLLELAPGEAGRLLGFQVATEELGRGIRSFLHGMAELPERLAVALRKQVEVRLQTTVTHVAPRTAGVTITTLDGKSHDFDNAVVATTAHSAAALLADAFGLAARALGESTRLSSLTVSLAFRSECVHHPLNGTGFIVTAPEELGGVRAVTFASSKLPNRAPPGGALFRLFFRPSDHDLQALSDRAWAERAERALSAALPLSAAADRAWVSRWPDALPLFDDAHRARVTALEAVLVDHSIQLAGAAFHGAGIDAAIRSAEIAARAPGRT
jgi:protoporphyrinogen/coproporphyrinogen III oxidase